jgi:hypothetical protein
MDASSSSPSPQALAAPPIDALSPEAVRRRRWSALAVAVGTGMLLGLAWWLQPSPNGFGTHQALGLPPCSWPDRFGVPCPSCGMTTAFSYAAKGRFVSSFLAQPMGMLLALAAGGAFVVSLWTLVSGRTLAPVYARMWNARLAWILGIIAVLSWGYKAAVMCGWMG